MTPSIPGLVGENVRGAISAAPTLPWLPPMGVLAATLLLACSTGYAQRPVYQCSGVYTDQPCQGGREVDIAPTRGAHSMSGAKKQSFESVMDEASQQVAKSRQQAFIEADRMLKCHNLMLERQAIDRSGAERLNQRRFEIRQQQFSLKCERT